jgi:hypothetical protein
VTPVELDRLRIMASDALERAAEKQHLASVIRDLDRYLNEGDAPATGRRDVLIGSIKDAARDHGLPVIKTPGRGIAVQSIDPTDGLTYRHLRVKTARRHEGHLVVDTDANGLVSNAERVEEGSALTIEPWALCAERDGDMHVALLAGKQYEVRQIGVRFVTLLDPIFELASLDLESERDRVFSGGDDEDLFGDEAADGGEENAEWPPA